MFDSATMTLVSAKCTANTNVCPANIDNLVADPLNAFENVANKRGKFAKHFT